MSFRSIHTQYGLERMALAEASGVPINLTHVAVGDGNGNPVTPSDGQTTLVREIYRTTVNRVYQSEMGSSRVIVEMVIPATVGGFTMREVGIFDSEGGLFVVGNLPDSYKPTSDEGAFSDSVIRVEIAVSNASVITLQVDPNVALATRSWVLTNVNACLVLPGGTTGQVLRKVSNACGAVEWANPTDANVVVDVIEEEQTLAAAQTVVTWADVTNNGLAVYIEGVRLHRGVGADRWLPDATDPDSKIVLGKSYPAGTKIIGAQNDPLGGVEFPLARDANLADVPDKAAGRANLGVMSIAETRAMAPAGIVAHFARNTAPSGWLKANGAAVSRTAYADLFAAIGTTFGAGDGFNTFNVPDLRGEFVRGWDDGRGVDAFRTFGGSQASQNASHSHSYIDPGHSHGGVPLRTNDTDRGEVPANSLVSVDNLGITYSAVTNIVIQPSGGSEARPRNVALLACIKF